MTRYAIDPTRPTMAWVMIPQKHTLASVFRAVDLTGRFQQIVRGEDMVFVDCDVAIAIAEGRAVAR